MPPPTAIKYLRKKAKHGFHGYPLATIVFYGPDDRRATKVAAGLILVPGQEPAELERWFATDGDVREDGRIAEEIKRFITARGVRTVVIGDRIFGCPHEEGIDYDGPICPKCPFWAGRDRATGRVFQ